MKERRDTLLKHYKEAVAAAKDETGKKTAEKMVQFADAVSADVVNLEKAVESGAKETMESTFMTLHEDFYKILETVEEKK